MRQSRETFMRSLSVAGAWRPPPPPRNTLVVVCTYTGGGIAITFNTRLSRSPENTALCRATASGHTPTLVSSFHQLATVKVELNSNHRLAKVELNAKLVAHHLEKVLVGV